MSLVQIINDNWGWTDLEAREVIAKSPMGHLVICDSDGQFHYLDPDGMAIIPLGTKDRASAYLSGDEARELWSGGALVEVARKRLGEPPDGSVFTLKPHAMVTGDYTPENMCIFPLEELIAFSGDVARQIKDLPDGAQIKFEVIE